MLGADKDSLGRLMITKALYEEGFKGFSIYACAVRAKDAFSFLLVSAESNDNDDGDGERDKRIVTYFLSHEGGPVINLGEYTEFAGALIAVSQHPVPQALMVARFGHVAVLGGGINSMEADIPRGGAEEPIYTSVHGLATIEGYVYAAGPWRAVARRVGPDQWESLADRTTLPVPKRNNHGSNNEGFNAIDGFNARDIYCGGGHGDLWRYDGTRWYHCPIPTNMIIETICCAGDGYVYVGLQQGSVLKGRGDSWSLIHKGEFSLPFRSMAWYDGRVWCTSDYGIWTIENDRLGQPDLPPAIRSCSGSLSVGDGVLLLAGMYGAAVFDGNTWEVIIDPFVLNSATS